MVTKKIKLIKYLFFKSSSIQYEIIKNETVSRDLSIFIIKFYRFFRYAQ